MKVIETRTNVRMVWYSASDADVTFALKRDRIEADPQMAIKELYSLFKKERQGRLLEGAVTQFLRDSFKDPGSIELLENLSEKHSIELLSRKFQVAH